MMTYFPEIYEDELAYSVFARYHAHTGNLFYTTTAEQLFGNSVIIPSTEFIATLSDSAIEMIERQMPFDTFIENHTMLPYHIRFLPLEKRRKAFEMILSMDKSYFDALNIRNNRTKNRHYMRYCPLCVRQDRENHGETFWHRRHQLDYVEICLIHSCCLLPSIIGIDSIKHPYAIIPAESVIPEESPIISNIVLQERKIAEYAIKILDAPIDLQNDASVSAFLHAGLLGTKYTTARGEVVSSHKMFDDMAKYYCDLPQYSIQSWRNIQKVFRGLNCHVFDICQIALFIGFSVEDILDMHISDKPFHKMLDERVLDLRKQGRTYSQIAKELHVPLGTIKTIGQRQIHNAIKF